MKYFKYSIEKNPKLSLFEMSKYTSVTKNPTFSIYF